MGPYGNWYPWFQSPYNPHYYDDRRLSRWRFFYRAQLQSPHLHPALGACAKMIRYDFSKAPRDRIYLSAYNQIALQPAFTRLTYQVCIISKTFPWMAEIRAPAGSPVTCGAILQGLYNMLQEPIADSEWGIVVHDRLKRMTIQRAAKARRRKDNDERLKRIDWLGESTEFRGLERNEEFERKRLLPGMQGRKEVWVVKFGKP